MSTTNGYYSIQGYQVETANAGRINLGPFNVPMSGVSEVIQEAIFSTTVTVAVPAGAFGVAIIPPIGSASIGASLRFKTVIGDTGTYLSTSYPTVIEFDHVNNRVPADIYLESAGGTGVLVGIQFL